MKHDRFLIHAHTMAALAAAAALLASAIAGGVWKYDAAPPPFIWRDVALVCFLSALPLAASFAALLQLRFSFSKHLLALLALETLVLLVIPRLYIHARCSRDVATVVGLFEQSRFGEAQTLLMGLKKLSPRRKINGYSLLRLSADMDRAVHNLDLRVAPPLSPIASDQDRYSRARDLAMLGRTTAALATLESSPTLSSWPAAAALRGTIHESLSRWPAALDSYTGARTAWHSRPDSPERTAGLIQAATGIGYSQRKLGRLAEAEAAFQEVLRLAPTADSHFLLAQFYEDTQQSTKAQSHAGQAISLDPQKYTRRAEQLIDKLQTSHFGCLTVFSTKSNNFARPSIVPTARNP
jgi:tetratricopeptide (TPR) repeat protein